MHRMFLFWTFALFSPGPVGLLSRCWKRGTEDTLLYTPARVWVAAGSQARALGV